MTLARTRPTRTGGDLARGLAAALALVVFVVGVPAALLALAPVWLPTAPPSWGRLGEMLTSPDDGTLLVAALAIVAWACWAAFTACVVVELVAGARLLRAPTLPLLGGFQRAASTLIATAGVLLAVTTNVATGPAAAAVAAPLVAPADPGLPSAAPASSPTDVGSAQAPAASTRPTGTNDLPTITVERGDTLWDLAERYLGAGTRYGEIRDLNTGRAQPDGRTLVNADWIMPGWTLLLPADATDVPIAAAPPRSDALPGQTVVIVQPGDTLWDIAARHLGNGERYTQIVDMNAGRTQPDGGRLIHPDLIRPGWILVLPDPVAAPPSPSPSPAAPLAAGPAAPSVGVDGATPPPTSPPRHVAQPVAPELPAGVPPAEQADELVAVDDAVAEASATSRWFLGLAALGAAGVVGELTRRRHLQQRARRVGETIPMPAPGTPPAAAERTLRTAVAPVTVAALTSTLANLGRRCSTTGRELPRIGALLLDETELRLLLVEESLDAVEPFTAIGPRTWVAATIDVAAAESIDEPGQCTPYPLLVTLGHTDGATLIINLEAAGTLAITGDDTVAEEALRALVVEVATSDLASQLAVKVDVQLADLASAFEDHRLRLRDPRDDPATTARDTAAALTARGQHDLLQARAHGDASDALLPVLFVEHTRSGRASVPWSGVVTLTRDSAPDDWTIEAAVDGTARLEPLGIDYCPQRLTAEHLDQLRALLVTSIPPEPRRTADEPATRVEEDLATLQAAHPVESGARAGHPVVSIEVLGPIQVTGLPATAGRLTARTKELLVYLALHGPVTGADIEEVLWNGERIRPGTRATFIYRARDRVGREVLPTADDDGLFHLGPAVSTDWNQFQHLVAEALAHNGTDRIEGLTAALALVRDRPFRGITGGEYPWADYDIQQMTSAVADTALILARLLHEAGKDRDAVAAATRGLSVEPFSESLQQVALAATEALAGPDQARRRARRLAAEMERLDPELA